MTPPKLTKGDVEAYRGLIETAVEVSGCPKALDVNALCDLAVAGLAAQWRPIEEAKEDRVLICNPFQNWIEVSELKHGKWWACGQHEVKPTHFMPLPLPPQVP